jgi:hypothetical protein
LGGRVRCIIDMQGTPLQGEAGMAPICRAVAGLNPRVMLIGGRFQAPIGDTVATAIVGALGDEIARVKAIGWLAGNKGPEARAILAAGGFEVHEALDDALRAAVAAG